MSLSFRRCRAFGAAAVALLVAKAWLTLAPGAAVRWGSLIAATGRGSRGLFTGRGLHGFGFALTRGLFFGDPRDPRAVETISDLRLIDTIRDLSTAVTAIGRRAPFSATCLDESLALVMLLSLSGIPAHLVLGVSRAAPTLRAHAWVECGGTVVHGGAHAADFAPLLRPSPPAPSSSVPSSCPG